MPLDQPPEPRRDRASTPIDRALLDGAAILDAYARFTLTALGILLFPYAGMQPSMSAPKPSDAAPPLKLRHTGILQVVLALVIGAVLGRRFVGRR